MRYTVFRISKRNGKFRTIYSPDPGLKQWCRTLLPGLMRSAEKLDVHKIQHGFTSGRSPVTNAAAHAGFQYTLTMDLENFFDTVTPSHLPSEWRNPGMFPDGAARQGLPTSPALANIAASGMDSGIMALQRKYRSFRNFIYTRYADDLTFSSNSWDMIVELRKNVPVIIEKHGFKVNPSKTKIQCSKSGRRMITGIAVDASLDIPRKVKRRLRAMKNQLDTGFRGRTLKLLAARQKSLMLRHGRDVGLRAILVGAYNGLVEWSYLTPPEKQSKVTTNTTQKIAPPTQTIRNIPYYRKIMV